MAGLVAAVSLEGCGLFTKSYDFTEAENSIYVEDNATIRAAMISDFDKDYYSIDELAGVAHTHNVPDVQRCRQREHQAGEQNGRCCPFKLTRLSIVEVGGTQLHKEENGEDHINGRKYHIVDNGLDLP